MKENVRSSNDDVLRGVEEGVFFFGNVLVTLIPVHILLVLFLNTETSEVIRGITRVIWRLTGVIREITVDIPGSSRALRGITRAIWGLTGVIRVNRFQIPSYNVTVHLLFMSVTIFLRFVWLLYLSIMDRAS